MSDTDAYDYEDLVPLQKHRRDELVNYLKEPEKVTTSGLFYRKFLRAHYMESCDPEKAEFLSGQYLFSTYGINNSNVGLYTEDFEYKESVTGIIRIFPGFLKIDSGDCFRFFRTYPRAYEPLEEQELAVHVFDYDTGLLPRILKDLSCAGSHISCYGVWKDPVIYNGDFKDVLIGCCWATELIVEMSFQGDYLVFMEPGVFYFLKTFGHNPDGAPILEPDFRKKDA
ncbi:hypothetical protein [Succinimonas sp.]|uniref:hypothetical protein n=1 Tax=Succinimonas sp. TaxID=1936151 RepID=UPI003863C3B6